MTTPSATPATSDPDIVNSPHRVVVIGSGFGGLFGTKALRGAPVEVTMVAKTTYHLFQPLLYQLATGVLSEGEVAPPTREVLAGQDNATVLLGEVTEIDLEAKTVTSKVLNRNTVTPYDSLVVATGCDQSYFGHDRFAQFAPGMKSVDDALELRGRIFGAFELAELATTEAEVDRLLTFAVVGAGPTGVELAGQIVELARRTLPRDFRRINTCVARVILIDAADRVLSQYGDDLGGAARRQLEAAGVELQLGWTVVDMDDQGLQIRHAAGHSFRIEAVTKVWAAGVKANPLTTTLAEQTGARLDRAGRIAVQPDLTLPGHPEVYLVGDLIADDDRPGVCPLAIQSARYAAKSIRHQVTGKPSLPPFRYFDKGSIATISRFRAVAMIGPLRLTGVTAWLAWLLVHLVYITGFKNRITALLHWIISFIGRGRSQRTVTEQQTFARLAMRRLRRGAAELIGSSDRQHTQPS